MTIWVIGRGYPTKRNGMRGSFELEQAKMLARRGNRVAYLSVTLHPYKKIRKWGACAFKEDDVDVFCCSVPFFPERLNLHPRRLLKWLWDDQLGSALALTGMPDVIHLHYPAMNTVPESVLPYRLQGVKLVTTEHWTKVLTGDLDRFTRRQLAVYADKADAVLCVGYPLIESIRKLTGTEKEITVVPNVYSKLFSLPAEQDAKKSFRFIAVGRLAPVKQMYETVEAFADAFKTDDNVRLTIVGGGSEFKRIQRRIAELNMQSQINMTGTLSRQETAEQVKRADALVCFSRLETFGVPVIEAWACGKPVIASDALGFLEYWQDGLGEIISMNSPQQLTQAMKKMYAEREKYDGAFLSDFAKRNFSEDAVCQKLMSVYENA